MKIEIITSFNKHYYNLIGKDCVETFLKFWPKELSLTCYVEEFSLPPTKRIKQIDFNNLPKEYFEFQNSDMNDRVKIFAKKAYSIIHAFENSEADRIIWIDADIITHNRIPIEYIETLCNDQTLATFMGVYHNFDKKDPTSRIVFSAETGFFIVNKNHKGFKEFSSRYREYYDKKLYHNLRRFYDGEVFGAVVDELRDRYVFNDLVDVLEKKYNTPLGHLELGINYLKHYKSKHSKIDFTKEKTID